MTKKRKRKSIYQKYREIIRKPDLSDEDIDKMRKNIRLIALSIVEHVTKTKVNQIY